MQTYSHFGGNGAIGAAIGSAIGGGNRRRQEQQAALAQQQHYPYPQVM